MLRDGKQSLLLDVLVHPRATHARLGPVHGDRFKVAVTAPPADGAANIAVIALIAKALGCPKRDVIIASGAQSRQKTLAIHGLTRANVATALGLALPEQQQPENPP